MTTLRHWDEDAALDELYAELSDSDLQPLWRLHGLLTPEPVVAARPYRWEGRTLRRLAERSGKLVGIDRGGDRRVLACANPGLAGAPYATSTLWAAVQYLGPGELAPAHRHTPAALRFVLSGAGVWTLVDGDPLHMARGDLVLTPSRTFHEHHNPGDEPMTWMDVLDLPIVAALDAVFYEDGCSEDVDARTDPSSVSERLYGAGAGLLPVDLPDDLDGSAPARRPYSSLTAYRWEHTDLALRSQLEVTGRPQATLRFTDPRSGADVLPTMRCEMTRVRAASRTSPTRQTGSRVATVLNGSGSVTIAEEVFALEPGDIFVVPSWSRSSLAADSELDVFTTSDAPVLEALGLFRRSA